MYNASAYPGSRNAPRNEDGPVRVVLGLLLLGCAIILALRDAAPYKARMASSDKKLILVAYLTRNSGVVCFLRQGMATSALVVVMMMTNEGWMAGGEQLRSWANRELPPTSYIIKNQPPCRHNVRIKAHRRSPSSASTNHSTTIMASSAEPQDRAHQTLPNDNDTANLAANADVTMSSSADAESSSPPPSAAAPAAAPSEGSGGDGDGDSNDEDTLSITLTHHGAKHTLHLPSSATISTLSDAIAAQLSIPPTHQKLLITPKPGLLKPPFSGDNVNPAAALPLAPLVAAKRKIVLMGSTPAEVSSLQASVSHATSQHAARASRRYAVTPATPARTAGRGVLGSAKASEEAQYTFHAIRPLAYLPRPERSTAFLERLRDDAGIRAAMRRHKFSVGLLTEMDPAMHTTHESRTLGLNRNRGEVIELRLRTDAYDGYRDYKTIRRTLCHELTHNVWGDHDRNFWNLCREIEREVERDDWRGGSGRRVGGVGGDEVYEPADDPERRGDVFDHGGWTGGEFVLGGSGGAAIVGSSGTVTTGAGEGMSRREVLARAAEERARRARQEKGGEKSEEGKS